MAGELDFMSGFAEGAVSSGNAGGYSGGGGYDWSSMDWGGIGQAFNGLVGTIGGLVLAGQNGTGYNNAQLPAFGGMGNNTGTPPGNQQQPISTTTIVLIVVVIVILLMFMAFMMMGKK